jgi:uncharacterized cupin superfamily protein
MITATPFLAAAADAKLEDWGPLEEALPISGPTAGGEPMHTSGTTLWTGEGGREAGVWECTAGPSRWSLEGNEFVHILSGRMTVTARRRRADRDRAGRHRGLSPRLDRDLADLRDYPEAVRALLALKGRWLWCP